MANEEHLAILRQGVEAWNRWLEENSFKPAELQEADLQGANLQEADLRWGHLQGADLAGADLFKAILHGVNLSQANLQDTNLFKADLQQADLRKANLQRAVLQAANLRDTSLQAANMEKAVLFRADLQKADLQGADLQGADLQGADFQRANLQRANLQGADLRWANLQRADLAGANITSAILEATIFANTDLNNTVGLEAVVHRGPSSLGIDTLLRSSQLPEAFLHGCGVPDIFIEYLPSLLGAMEPIQYHSCFISYSSKDGAFAKRLHERMRAEHLRVWFAPEDIQGGKKIHEQLEGAIQMYDKLLLVLSDHSLSSKWVMSELSKARRAELNNNRRKLFPIRLTDMSALQNWESFDIETETDLARDVREYHIPDFSNWKDHDAFELAFARLLRDLRATNEPPVAVQPLTQEQRENLIRAKTRQLHVLEQQVAQLGLHTPAHKVVELEDLREEIERLKVQREG